MSRCITGIDTLLILCFPLTNYPSIKTICRLNPLNLSGTKDSAQNNLLNFMAIPAIKEF